MFFRSFVMVLAFMFNFSRVDEAKNGPAVSAQIVPTTEAIDTPRDVFHDCSDSHTLFARF